MNTDRILAVNGLENPTLDEEVLIFDVNSLVSSDASIVQISALIGTDIVTVKGTSRRHPEDKPNDDIGLMLAQGRAYEALGRKINKRARGLVAQQDHNKEMKPVQRLARERWEVQQHVVTVVNEIVDREVAKATGKAKPVRAITSDSE